MVPKLTLGCLEISSKKDDNRRECTKQSARLLFSTILPHACRDLQKVSNEADLLKAEPTTVGRGGTS